MSKYCLTLAISFFFAAVSLADEQQPIAIRHWGEGQTTIESMWGFHIGLDLKKITLEKLPFPLDFHLTGTKQKNESRTIIRKPNEENVSTQPNSEETETLPYSCRCILDTVTDGSGGNEQLVTGFLFQEFAVLSLNRCQPDRIVANLRGSIESGKLEIGKGLLKNVAIVLNNPAFKSEHAEQIASLLKPELMVVDAGVEIVGETKVEQITHNTVAFAKAAGKSPRIVSLGSEVYRMTQEVADLFEKKETSQRESARFFASLSIEQLNFKPSNGTHTPRWNTEHMMGRELVFFSQIYNAVDPTIPVLDLNPRQMPEDYQFAHPDWTGAEEARQTQRVERFTRRFAYLLDGLDLDKRAPGSRFWTPRALLKQMERHYKEHTGNVKKKMELPGWPKSK